MVMSMKSRIGRVYFVAAPALQAVKIGFTQLPPIKRLQALQQGMPLVDMKLIGSFPGPQRLETRYHRCFEATRIKGEWFKYDKMMVLAVLGLVLPTKFKGEWRLLWDDDPRVKPPRTTLASAPRRPPRVNDSEDR